MGRASTKARAGRAEHKTPGRGRAERRTPGRGRAGRTTPARGRAGDTARGALNDEMQSKDHDESASLGPASQTPGPQARARARQHSVSPASKTRWPQHNFSVQQHPAARPHQALRPQHNISARQHAVGPASRSFGHSTASWCDNTPRPGLIELSIQTQPRSERSPVGPASPALYNPSTPSRDKGPSARPLPGPSGGPWHKKAQAQAGPRAPPQDHRPI